MDNAELSYEELIENLSHEDETERIYAAEDLGYMGDERAIAVLSKRFTVERSIAVKEAISLALERFDSPQVVEVVTQWLFSDKAYTRNMGVQILQNRGELNIPYLENIYKTADDPDIRKFIVDCSAKFAHENCLAFMELGLLDSDVNVRITAVEYIGQRQLIELKSRVLAIFREADDPMMVTSCLQSIACFDDIETFQAIKEKFPEIGFDQLIYLPSIASFYGRYGSVSDIQLLERILETSPGQIDAVLSLGIIGILERDEAVEIPESILTWIDTLLDESDEDWSLTRSLDFLSQRKSETGARKLLEKSLHCRNKRARLLSVEILSSEIDDNGREAMSERLKTETDAEVKEALSNAVC